jgi:hypothetical protein
MDKDRVLSIIGDVRNGNVSGPDFLELRAHIDGMDPHLNTKWGRRLKKILSRIGNVHSNDLLERLTPDCPQDLNLLRLATFAGIDIKEVGEVLYFNQAVTAVLGDHFDHVYDLCSGNGLNGAYWLINDMAGRVHYFDLKKNHHFEKLRNGLPSNYEHHGVNILEEDIEIEKGGLVASIHACGVLTDKVMNIAMAQRNPFAVVPCCNDYDNNVHFSPEVIKYFEDKDGAIDAARIRKAQEQGYNVVLRAVPKDITTQNKVIIGIPSD